MEAILLDLRWLLPEFLVGGGVLVILLADLAPRWRRAVPFLALLALAGAGAFAVESLARGVERTVFSGAVAVDGLSSFFRLAFLGASFLVGVFSIPAVRDWASGKGEYFALLLACTFGMLLMAGANDMLMMVLSIELVSLTGYVMTGLRSRDRKGVEASLKYLIYGAAASGLMIYGMSFLYGLTGTLRIQGLGTRLAELNVPPTMALLTGVLVMAGFGYKIASVPFHMWCPDVYEGAPTPVAAFFSVGPKAAGFAVLARFLWHITPREPAAGPFEWNLLLALMAVLTMAVGNLAAIHQQDLKRLLAYSSIAHAGYMLLAFAVFTPQTVSAVLFYVVVYVLMNLGAFLVVLVLEERHGVRTVDGCRGAGWRAPGLCGLMAVFLFSLTGLPPTAGFAGKLLVFSAVIRYGLESDGSRAVAPLAIPLVVIAVAFTVVSLFYYARIVAAMFLVRPRDEAAPAPATGGVYGAVLWVLAAGTLGLGLFWGPLQGLADAASRSLFK